MGGFTADIVVFVVFVAGVVTLGLLKSRSNKKKDAQDFFLAGRGLSWWLIGFSLIAANISTEQFVGMSGNAASHVGLAIASYEWMAAITLIVVAFGFLPHFLRAGIYTMPEFLELRFNTWARLIMAGATVLIYLLLLGAVTYSGALTMQTLFARYGLDVSLGAGSFFIALIAMIYVVTGGLKASVWADLVQGSALVIGGAIVMFFAFDRLGDAATATTVLDVATGEVGVQTLDPSQGALARFMELNANRLNMFLPSNDSVLPWTALLLGLWIPNFYYWGLNQYITQRTLGSSSLAQGQKGIVFASYLKLVIPFIVVIPGIIAFNLFSDDMRLDARGDAAGALAMYQKANPDTRFVELRGALPNAEVAAHEGPGYVIAVYEDDAARTAVTQGNPYVLPMTRDAYERAQPATYQAFSTKQDAAWQHVNPELMQELTAYNARVEGAARSAGEATSTQALTAFKYDTALGHLLGMLPQGIGLLGFVLAALLGAVVSSLAAMLNAASTIFTMDIFHKYVRPEASQSNLVVLGRIAVVGFAVVAFVLAPALGNPNLSNSIFTIIQGGQGLISPGILSVFVFGFLVRRAPRGCGVAGLVTNMLCYGSLWYLAANTKLFEGIGFLNNFLNWMAISFVLCLLVMGAMTLARPLKEPIVFENRSTLDLQGSRGAKIAGIVCVVLTLLLYVIFSPLGIAR